MGNSNQIGLIRVGPKDGTKWLDVTEQFVAPAVDLYETSQEFVVKLDMPGVAKEGIHVTIEPGQLTIKGVTSKYHPQHATVVFTEIGTKTYFRTFKLGVGVNYDGIQASLEDGVLTIVLPKTDDMKTKEIPIQ